MSLVIEYNIITKADTIQKDQLGFYSAQDSYQQQASYNNGGQDNTASVKRLDFLIKPTSSTNPSVSRIIDINLESMQVDYLRIIHLKSNNYVLISTADTLNQLTITPREVCKVLFKDYGPPLLGAGVSGFSPDLPNPKYIRLINPIELNGGGSGNDIADLPIEVSLHLITNKFNS